MPGAWEFADPSVAVVILTREIISMKWAVSFRNMQLPDGHGLFILSGMPFDHARNHGCKVALEGGYKYILFIDDDVVLPADACARLMAHNLDVVSGVYERRQEPLVPCMLKDTPEGPKWIHKLPENALVEVDLVGAGCLMIKTDLIRRMGSHPFEWRNDRWDLPESERLSEDFSFCRRVQREFKKQIFVDTSIRGSHVGLSESIGGKLIPCKLG